MKQSSNSTNPNSFTRSESALTVTRSSSIKNEKCLEANVLQIRSGENDDPLMLGVPCFSNSGGIENTIQVIKEKGINENAFSRNPFNNSKYEVRGYKPLNL